MPRRPSWVAAGTFWCVLSFVLPTSTLARWTHIPTDNFPTIQSAIDAGLDTIFVAPGIYGEFLYMSHDLVLLPETDSPAIPMPSIDGIQIRSEPYAWPPHVTVRGFHVMNHVTC